MNIEVYVLVLFQFFKVCYGQRFTTWGEHQYFWSGSPQNFTSAQRTCTEIRGPLASIHSGNEQRYIYGEARGNQLWIGMQTTTPNCNACSGTAASCTGCRNNWYWIDGSDMNYQNWRESEPTGGGQNCVRMRNDNDGTWADAGNCNWKYHVLCKRHLCSPGLHISCGDHGTCHAENGSARCVCEDGYGAPICTDIDECANDASCLHGVCNNTVGSFACQCDSGYEGHTCNTDIDECSIGSPCTNAVCNNTQGSFSCECLHGYTGATCETDIDECTPTSPCGQGSCINNAGSYTCECFSGYEGDMCNTDIDECTLTSPCGQGTCMNQPGSYTCECASGYEGEMCDTDVNECSSMICQNGGRCDNLMGSFECICQLGLTGSRCETNIDNCVDAECNNGTCVDELATFSCQCEPGYQGRYCDIESNQKINPSSSVKTQNSNEEPKDLWIAFYVGIAGCCVAVSLLLYFLFTDHTVKKTLKEKFSKNKEFSNIEEPCVNESALHPNGETPM